jgi:ketosteroid isomerase-like protein
MPSAEEVVREVFAAFARRDLPALLASCAPDVEFWPEGTGEQAGRSRAEPYRGHTGLAQYLADVAAVWERLEVDPRDLRVAGAGIIAFGRASGRTRAGDEVEVPVIWVLKLRGGLLSFGRVVRTEAQAEAVAAAPVRGSAPGQRQGGS